MTKIIDASIIMAIIIVGCFTILSNNAVEGLAIKGGFLAQNTTEILIYLGFVVVLIVTGINKVFTYLIAAPLLVIVIFMIPVMILS